jgi:hypothetical protein
VNVTDAGRSARQERSAEELRAMLALTLTDVRGGDRFDVQWSRAVGEIDTLYAALQEQQRNHDQALGEYRRALDAVTQEVEVLRARRPVAIARRVAGGALRRSGLRRPG